jgi:hypothetical protein
MQSQTDNAYIFSQQHAYGILLSGGIDSAILLYLLIKENLNIQIQPFTIAKTDGAYLYADPIIDHFNKKFNLMIPKTIVVGDPTVYHRLQSTTAVKEIFEKYPVDYLYIGLNRNPPELANLPGAPVRDTKSTNPQIILPFVDLYKHNILEFMYDDNQEDLIDITHSCTEQSVGRCNQCWQCTERAWAFEKLNKIDTGTL